MIQRKVRTKIFLINLILTKMSFQLGVYFNEKMEIEQSKCDNF